MASKEFLVDVIVDGDVGIGTDGPSTSLEVSSSGVNGIDLSQSGSNSSQSGRLFFTTNTPTEGFLLYNNNGKLQINSGGVPNDTSGTERLTIAQSTGNVGIGTNNPQEMFHVQNYTTGESHQAMFKGGAVDIGDYSYISLNNGYISDYNKEVRLAAVSESTFGNKTGFAILTSPSSSGASGNERLRVTHNGDVGIGTDSPTEKLEVEDSGTVGVNKDVLTITNKVPTSPTVDTTVGMNFNLQQSTNSAITYGAIRVGEHSGTGSVKGSMRFMVQDYSGGFNLAERMRIESNGNVGIGTDNPNRLLTVETTGSGSYLALNSSSNNTTIGSDVNGAFIVFDDSASAYRMVIEETTGDVGIGNSNPSYKLDVTGAIRATGTITENSDERLKENINTIENACDKVSQIRGVEYNKIGEEGKKIGVIAQEIEKVIPEVVTEDKDGIKSVAYTNLVGLLIQSNKELIERVTELENIINNKD